MNKNLGIASVAITCLISVESYADSNYRKCMKDEMKSQLEALNCDFGKLNTARMSANSKCGPLILNEVEVESEDFKAKIDILKRNGNGDIDELAHQHADKCGVQLTIEGNRVRTTRVTR